MAKRLSWVVTVAVCVAMSLSMRAAETRLWNRFYRDEGGSVTGSSTVTTKDGRHYKSKNGLIFNDTGVTIEKTFIPREEVKELTIRRSRGLICCDALSIGLLPLYFIFTSLKEDGSPKLILLAIPGTVLAVVPAAVTGPPLLVVAGISRLRPAKVIKVIP